MVGSLWGWVEIFVGEEVEFGVGAAVLDGPADVNVELLDRVSLDGGERTGTLFAAVLDGSVDLNVETLDGALDRGVLAGTLLLLEVLVPE